MDTKKLRQKILDLAIHGKLVPQDPNDEPASVLLERIRKEKEQLIKEGKIKAPKKSKTAGDTSHYPKDVPFAVPEGWVWTEIAEISSSINYGVSESAKVTGKYRLLRITDIQDGKVSWESVPFTDYPEDKAKAFELSDGDILFARTGATVGKSYLVESAPNNVIFASYLIRVQYSHSVIPQYIKFFFESGYYWEQISSNSVGVGQPNVNGTSLGKLRIPLPPAAEQKRISEEAHRWMGVIDSLEFEAQHLSEDIGASKSKILDLAIHGKLVPQDPSDEPAIELLKRINPAFQPSYNLHYGAELPEGWQLCHIQDIASVELGKTLDRLKNTGEEKSYLCALNVKWEAFDLSIIKTIRIEASEKERYAVRPGDLLVCEGGDVGRSAIWTEQCEMYYQNALHRIRFKTQDICQEFFLYVLRYYKVRGIIDDVCKGVTIKHFTGQVLRSLDLPFPPVKEQARIVKMVKAYYNVLDEIVAGLN